MEQSSSDLNIFNGNSYYSSDEGLVQPQPASPSPFTDTLVAEVAAICTSDPLNTLGQSVQLVGTSHHDSWETPLAVTACWGLAGLLLVVVHQTASRSLYTEKKVTLKYLLLKYNRFQLAKQ